MQTISEYLDKLGFTDIVVKGYFDVRNRNNILEHYFSKENKRYKLSSSDDNEFIITIGNDDVIYCDYDIKDLYDYLEWMSKNDVPDQHSSALVINDEEKEVIKDALELYLYLYKKDRDVTIVKKILNAIKEN